MRLSTFLAIHNWINDAQPDLWLSHRRKYHLIFDHYSAALEHQSYFNVDFSFISSVSLKILWKQINNLCVNEPERPYLIVIKCRQTPEKKWIEYTIHHNQREIKNNTITEKNLGPDFQLPKSQEELKFCADYLMGIIESKEDISNKNISQEELAEKKFLDHYHALALDEQNKLNLERASLEIKLSNSKLIQRQFCFQDIIHGKSISIIDKYTILISLLVNFDADHRFSEKIERTFEVLLKKLRKRSHRLGFDHTYDEAQAVFTSLMFTPFYHQDAAIFAAEQSYYKCDAYPVQIDLIENQLSEVPKQFHQSLWNLIGQDLKPEVTSSIGQIYVKLVQQVVIAKLEDYKRERNKFSSTTGKFLDANINWLSAIIDGSLFKRIPVFELTWLDKMCCSVHVQKIAWSTEAAESLFDGVHRSIVSASNPPVEGGSTQPIFETVKNNIIFLNFLKSIGKLDFIAFMQQVGETFQHKVLSAYLSCHERVVEESNLLETAELYFKDELIQKNSLDQSSSGMFRAIKTRVNVTTLMRDLCELPDINMRRQDSPLNF